MPSTGIDMVYVVFMPTNDTSATHPGNAGWHTYYAYNGVRYYWAQGNRIKCGHDMTPKTRRRYPSCQPASRRLFFTPSFFPSSPPGTALRRLRAMWRMTAKFSAA